MLRQEESVGVVDPAQLDPCPVFQIGATSPSSPAITSATVSSVPCVCGHGSFSISGGPLLNTFGSSPNPKHLSSDRLDGTEFCGHRMFSRVFRV